MHRIIALLSLFLLTSATPSWMPSGFELEKSGKASLEIVREQGAYVDPLKQPLEEILFSDVDQTLLYTTTPILLKDKTIGSLVTWVEGGDLVALPNRSYLEAISLLETYLPTRPWREYQIDFNEMGSVIALDITKPIPNVLETLKKERGKRATQMIIVSARSSYTIPPAIKSYMTKRGLKVDAVFLVNNEEMMRRLFLAGIGLTLASKKALTMASLLQGYASQGFHIKKVSFYDDGDDNLIASMQLLPSLFKEIAFYFFDVIHGRGNCFHIALVAKGEKGLLYNAKGALIDEKELQKYKSHDCPLIDEIFWQRLKRE